MPLTTRLATPADLATLLDGINQLAAHHGDTATVTAETVSRDLFGPTPWAHALVAQTNTAITGYTILLPLAQVQFGRRGMDMHHLFTWPAHRGTGIGAALLQAAQSHARTLGCTYLTVGTHPDNHTAQRFYEHAGFTTRPPSPRYALALSTTG